MEGPISFWGYKEQESNLILPEHDDDDDDDDKKTRQFTIHKMFSSKKQIFNTFNPETSNSTISVS